MQRIKAIFSGRVQGVCFRYFTSRKANKIGLKGYVKNIEDGTVEVVAEGEKEKINELIKYCSERMPFAKVEKAKIKQEKYKAEFSGFGVRY